MVKNPPANAGDAGDTGSIPGSGKCSGEGKDNPLQWVLAWRATVLGVTKKSTLSDSTTKTTTMTLVIYRIA